MGLRRHPWLSDSSPEKIPNEFRIAILGDWATGMYGAPISAKSIQRILLASMQCHLGDIYLLAQTEVGIDFFGHDRKRYIEVMRITRCVYRWTRLFQLCAPSFQQAQAFASSTLLDVSWTRYSL